jgi:predicted naringenin-chalcone synthase
MSYVKNPEKRLFHSNSQASHLWHDRGQVLGWQEQRSAMRGYLSRHIATLIDAYNAVQSHIDSAEG